MCSWPFSITFCVILNYFLKQIRVRFYVKLFAHSLYVLTIHVITSHRRAYAIFLVVEHLQCFAKMYTNLQLPKRCSCVDIKLFSFSVVSHNATNSSHISKPGWIVVCDRWYIYMYWFTGYSFSDCVLVRKHIECSDYFGNHRQVYNTTGNPQDLAIVNDVAYYVQMNPGR